MIKRLVSLGLLSLVLPGCLFVELTGNVAGALVVITPLAGGPPVVDGLRTTGVDELRRLRGEDTWNGHSSLVQLLSVGYVQVPQDELQDDQLYLVRATGGRDMDWNGDQRIDVAGTEVDGSLHAIMTGRQLKARGMRVNLLSDALYRLVEPELPDLEPESVLPRLDELAAEAVPDIDGDGTSDYDDVLRWSRMRAEYPYPGDPEFLRRAEVAIGFGFEESINTLNAENLILRADWRPAEEGALHADALVSCATPVLVRDLCNFRSLPLIGEGRNLPGNDDIMARLVVTHDWMRHRFEQVLRRVPQDIRLLFRSVSAVVIGDDIRPSYFNPATAAIYLDAGILWVTQDERSVVSSEPDYRVEFGQQVRFADNWRYVDGNRPAFGELDENSNADIDNVAALMASLLFHELAHATDNIPPARIAGLLPDETPYDIRPARLSNDLADESPLRAAELFGVANVLFGGADPGVLEARYTAADIGALFEPDGASDLYAYYTPREDFAMLFEEAMMAIHYGFARDVAFTSVPDGPVEQARCADYRVGWGVRGRIATSQVLRRATQAVEALLPERDYAAELAGLPGPLAMDTRRDWCENLRLDVEPMATPLRAPGIVPVTGADRLPGSVLGRRRVLHR